MGDIGIRVVLVVVIVSLLAFLGERGVDYIHPLGVEMQHNQDSLDGAIAAQKKVEVDCRGYRYRLDAVTMQQVGKTYSPYLLLRPLKGDGAGISVPRSEVTMAYVPEDGGKERQIPLGRAEVEKSMGMRSVLGLKVRADSPL